MISGRNPVTVAQAVADLAVQAQADGRIVGQACDVTHFEDVQRLWAAAKDRFGRVDVWINNAGLAQPQLKFWEASPELVRTVVETNLTGSMYGCQVALKGFLEQGSGALYNMEGLGSDGRRVEGLTLYGSTKYSVRYLTQALAAEVQGGPVIVGAISPGMVVTDLLTAQYEGDPQGWERAKKVFNILADRVETVTPWIVTQILANTRNGVRIRWLTPAKLLGRFLFSSFQKRKVVE
jgi:NAD(P)-dependent dehydrogenase (short-subunit alcohol dehydrogenase family)